MIPEKICIEITAAGITTTLYCRGGGVVSTDTVEVLDARREPFETQVGVQKDPAPKPGWLVQPLRELRSGAIHAFMALRTHGGKPNGTA